MLSNFEQLMHTSSYSRLMMIALEPLPTVESTCGPDTSVRPSEYGTWRHRQLPEIAVSRFT